MNNKSYNPLDYVTDFGKVCMDKVVKYPKVKKYYDYTTGCVVIPYNDFNSNTKLHDEVCDLLFEKPFEFKGVSYNWALELLSGDALNEPMVSIRAVESWG